MCRVSIGDDFDLTQALASRLHIAIGARCGLQDEHGIAPQRFALDRDPRSSAADLFIACPKKDDALFRHQAIRRKSIQREECNDQAALHVESAWPISAPLR